MTKEKKRDMILVGGITGSGKTFFTNNLSFDYPRVIILSPIEADEDEYDGVMAEDFDDLVDKIDDAVKDGKKNWRFKLSDLSEVDTVYSFVYDLGNEVDGLLVVVEEAEATIPIGNAQSLSTPFRNLLYRGRHPQVSMIFAVQRFTLLNMNVRSQCRRFISFMQDEPDDISWLYRKTGRREVLDVLPELEPRQYIDINRREFSIHK